MLLRAANASARALGRPCARARPLSAHRLFSGATDDSHDDFKPKKKPLSSEPTASSDVSDIIKKQISDNSIMLYMKVILSYCNRAHTGPRVDALSCRAHLHSPSVVSACKP